MYKAILSAAVFITICASGAFVCLAGGVQWGTPDCGFGALATLFAAVVSVVAINAKEL